MGFYLTATTCFMSSPNFTLASERLRGYNLAYFTLVLFYQRVLNFSPILQTEISQIKVISISTNLTSYIPGSGHFVQADDDAGTSKAQ